MPNDYKVVNREIALGTFLLVVVLQLTIHPSSGAQINGVDFLIFTID